MPLGKYYCDYCDKQFQDTPSARRRHLQGSSIREPRLSGAYQDQDHPPLGGGVCNRYVRTGSCPYGDSCKYYHPQRNAAHANPPIMEDRNFVHNSRSQADVSLHKDASFPAALLANQVGTSLRNLPPSLWPPPEGGYPPLPFIDWG